MQFISPRFVDKGDHRGMLWIRGGAHIATRFVQGEIAWCEGLDVILAQPNVVETLNQRAAIRFDAPIHGDQTRSQLGSCGFLSALKVLADEAI